MYPAHTQKPGYHCETGVISSSIRFHWCQCFFLTTGMSELNLSGFTTDSRHLMIAMMIIVCDRTVTWSPALVLPSCCVTWAVDSDSRGGRQSGGLVVGFRALPLSLYPLPRPLSLSNFIFKSSAVSGSDGSLRHDGNTQCVDISWSCVRSRGFNRSGWVAHLQTFGTSSLTGWLPSYLLKLCPSWRDNQLENCYTLLICSSDIDLKENDCLSTSTMHNVCACCCS